MKGKSMAKKTIITDEQLAAYIEGLASCGQQNLIERNMDVDTLEVLGVSRRALEEFDSSNVIALPAWDECIPCDDSPRIYNPLAMCGFLGDEEETKDEDDEIDKGVHD